MTMHACPHTLTTITDTDDLPRDHPAHGADLPPYVTVCLGCGAVRVPMDEVQIEPAHAPTMTPGYAMPLDITKALRANEALMVHAR